MSDNEAKPERVVVREFGVGLLYTQAARAAEEATVQAVADWQRQREAPR